MIDSHTLLTYVAVVFGLFLIPGPAVLLVLAQATTGGRSVGMACGAGIACGDLLHTVLATVGLSAILMTSAVAFSIVKYAGVIYLLYLGIRALKDGGVDLQFAAARRVTPSLAFRQAILAEVLNPKTALFFLAFLPQFVRPEHGMAVLQFAMLGLIFAAMSIVYTVLLAIGASKVGGWLRRHRGIGRWQGRVVGTIYLALGARLAFQQQ
jgi:threonine/homoserine/homoserine lactone efflux protein